MSAALRRLPSLTVVAYAAVIACVARTATWNVFQRFFSYDDAFFYLTIARNIARGAGSTFDGLAPTSGYQPLWLGLLTAVFRITGPLTSEQGLRVVCVISGLCMLLSVVLLIRWLDRMGVSTAVQLLAVLGVLAQVGFWFFGMEVHLTVLVGVVFFERIWAVWDAPIERSRLKSSVVIALVGAALALTRLDLIVWVGVLLSALAVWRHTTGVARGVVVRCALVEFGLLSVVLLAYFAMNRVAFGHWLPISAALKAKPFGFPLASIMAGRTVDWVQGAVIVAVAIGTLCWTAPTLFGRRRDHSDRFVTYAAGLAVAVLAHLAGLLLGARLLELRYLGLTSLATVVLVAIAAREWGVRRPAMLVVVSRLAIACSLIAVVELGGVVLQNALPSTPPLGSLAPFRAAMAPFVTRDSIVYLHDASGEVGWFCECHVINGDGLVNSWEFQDYVQQRRVKDYLDKVHTQFVISIDDRPDVAADTPVGVYSEDWSRGESFPVLWYPAGEALVTAGQFRLFRYGSAVR